MQEFKIEINAEGRKRQLQFRILAWGAILLIFLIAILVFVLGVTGILGPGYHPLAAFLFVSTPLLGIVGGGILACREALRLAERQMIFVLGSSGIVRKRKGFPDIAISFSEIQYVGEELRWLIVKSKEPQRKIAIPNDVSGYEIIRAELARHHSLDSEPISKHATSLVMSALWLIAMIISCSLFLWSQDVRVRAPAGFFAICAVLVSCVRLWKLLDKPTQR